MNLSTTNPLKQKKIPNHTYVQNIIHNIQQLYVSKNIDQHAKNHLRSQVSYKYRKDFRGLNSWTLQEKTQHLTFILSCDFQSNSKPVP